MEWNVLLSPLPRDKAEIVEPQPGRQITMAIIDSHLFLGTMQCIISALQMMEYHIYSCLNPGQDD